MFNIEWKENSLRNLHKLDITVARKIIKTVEEMQVDPFVKDIKKLKGSSECRLRVGDYRIIFSIEKELITILKVGHRQHIYER